MANYQIADVEFQIQRAEGLVKIVGCPELEAALNKLKAIRYASERASVKMDKATREVHKLNNELRNYEPTKYMSHAYELL